MSRGRRLRVFGVVLALASATILLAAPAVSADTPTPPPGWTGNGAPPGSYVGFGVSPLNVPAIDRAGTTGPVTLSRDSSLSGQALIDAFNNWATRLAADGVTTEYGWPATWGANGVQLQRTDDWCDASATTCHYRVISGGQFFFAAATPPADISLPPIDLTHFEIGTLSKAAPAPIVATLTYTKGGPGELGKLTLDGSGSHDPLGGTLTFSWTITRTSDGKVWAPPADALLTQPIEDPGEYCIDLSVVSSFDGASMPAGRQCITFTDGEVPAKPVSLPSGGGATAPAPSNKPIATVSFAKPSRNAPSVFGGGPSSPTVVWLWRPDFYQPSVDSKIPKTNGTPKLTGKSEILVSTQDGPEGASAGPWLGGLAAFGLIGGAFLFSRRRKLRMEP